MVDLGRRLRWNHRLVPILMFAAVLMTYGIWITEPHVLLPDEKSAVTKALWMGVNQSPFIPDFKKGGNLYLYVLAIAFIPPASYLAVTGRLGDIAAEATGLSDFFQASETLQDAFYLFVFTGRVVSGLLGLATIYVVYRIAAEEYSEGAGIKAAALLSVTAGFVQLGHYATEDMLLVFLLTVTLYFLRRSDSRSTFLAAGTAGLAVSAKATGAFIVFPLVHRILQNAGLKPKRSMRNLMTKGTVSLSAYLLTTPSLFIYPELFVQELAYETGTRGIGATSRFPGWIEQGFNLLQSAGWPLFGLFVIVIGWWGWRILTGAAGSFEKTAALFAGPYYLFIGSWSNTAVWYIMPLLPILAVLAGLFVTERLAQLRSRESSSRSTRHRLAVGLLVIIFIGSTVYAGASAAHNGTDARLQASAWASENIPADADVDLYSYRIYQPELPDGVNTHRYLVTTQNDSDWPTVYTRLQCQRPDYVVLSSLHYQRFFGPDKASNVSETYTRLLNGELGYQQVATFGSEPAGDDLKSTALLGVLPRDLAGDPYIIVLKRKQATPTC